MAKNGAKHNGGRPPKKYDPNIAKMVQAMSAYGVPQEDIAHCANGISVPTLQKLYGAEIKEGRRAADLKIRSTLYKQAVEEKNTACLIFLCKTRLGMKETSVVDHTSTDGTMVSKPALSIDLESFTPEQLTEMGMAFFKGRAEKS